VRRAFKLVVRVRAVVVAMVVPMGLVVLHNADDSYPMIVMHTCSSVL
jgi:hypothetical protein